MKINVIAYQLKYYATVFKRMPTAYPANEDETGWVENPIDINNPVFAMTNVLTAQSMIPSTNAYFIHK